MRSLGLVVLGAALVAFAPLASAQEDSKKTDEVHVRWFGQACFELRFPTGLTVICDPFDAAKIGKYLLPKDSKPDVVTISHEHFDHSNDKGVQGSPEVLRGLTSADPKTQDWKKHDVVRKGVRIRTVGVYHDPKEGAERGKNAIFVFEPETKGAFGTIAHLGDLGHVLTDEQVKAIGPVDALLIPVGGHFTVDAAEAKKVIEQLHPRVLVIPMHMKTDGLDPKIPLAPADEFLELFEGRVRKAGTNETTIPARREGEAEVVLLDWKHKEGGVKDSSGAGLALGGAKAWVNAQPGAKDAELHLAAELTATVGSKGGKLVVEAVLDGKKLAVEDDATGEKQPEGGFKLDANKKRVLKLVLAEGQKGAAGGSIQLSARLTTPDGGISQSSTKVAVQEVK